MSMGFCHFPRALLHFRRFHAKWGRGGSSFFPKAPSGAKKGAAALSGNSFRDDAGSPPYWVSNRMPRVLGPQWQAMVQLAVVTWISFKSITSSTAWRTSST